jgi:hypothetical protein
MAGGWELRATRSRVPDVEEHYHRQGTAYRRARQLYAPGYEITAVQYSIDDPPVPLAVYRFDGIRFVPIPHGSM